MISKAPLCLRHGSNGSPAAAAEVSQTRRSPDACRPGAAGLPESEDENPGYPKKAYPSGKNDGNPFWFVGKPTCWISLFGYPIVGK